MSNTIITEAAPAKSGASSNDLLWIQVVVSKSGGTSHLVRCFFGGIITCDCQGFGWNGRCSHQGIGQLQEAREALAEITLRPGNSNIAEQTRKAEIARRGAQAYADLFDA